jgi:hypothetical protein
MPHGAVGTHHMPHGAVGTHHMPHGAVGTDHVPPEVATGVAAGGAATGALVGGARGEFDAAGAVTGWLGAAAGVGVRVVVDAEGAGAVGVDPSACVGAVADPVEVGTSVRRGVVEEVTGVVRAGVAPEPDAATVEPGSEVAAVLAPSCAAWVALGVVAAAEVALEVLAGAEVALEAEGEPARADEDAPVGDPVVVVPVVPAPGVDASRW